MDIKCFDCVQAFSVAMVDDGLYEARATMPGVLAEEHTVIARGHSPSMAMARLYDGMQTNAKQAVKEAKAYLESASRRLATITGSCQ